MKDDSVPLSLLAAVSQLQFQIDQEWAKFDALINGAFKGPRTNDNFGRPLLPPDTRSYQEHGMD